MEGYKFFIGNRWLSNDALSIKLRILVANKFDVLYSRHMISQIRKWQCRVISQPASLVSVIAC